VGAPTAAAISGGLGAGLTALATLPSGAGDTDSKYYQKSSNWALFTHNIVHLGDALDLTLGLRYTHESKDVRLALVNNNATCAALQATTLPSLATNAALGSAAQLAGGILTLACLGNSSTGVNALTPTDSHSNGEFSGTAVLSYKVSPSTMIYGSYARGYKAGGYNLDRFELGSTGLAPAIAPLTYFSPRTNADAAALWFEPETVNAYEIGLKLNKPKWGANIAAFWQEFTNFQLNTFNGTSYVVQNINGCKSAKAANGTCTETRAGLVSKGVEIETFVSPIRAIRITTGVTYAATDYRSSLVGNGAGTVPLDPALFLLEGNTNSNAPRWVVTGSFAWTPSLGSSGLTGLLYIDARTTSGYNSGSDLYPEKRQQSYTVSNMRIGVRGRDERWALEFWGQNIFNEKYQQVVFNSPLQSSGPNNQSTAQLGRSGATMTNQLFSAYTSEPRTYGVTLRGKF
jgi:outer membrane receptor protein involved in Fe transport